MRDACPSRAHPDMSFPILALIGVTIIVSSFLSGVFGMAGGMVLLGVLLVFLDVAAAMILFSIIQFFANGLRAVEVVPDKALVYLLLGLMPFAVEIIPASMRPNIEWRGVPFITGLLT